MHNIAANIKALRTARGLTQDALAAQLHVTRQAVSNWENGKAQPDIETLKKLSQALNVPAEMLIYGKKEGDTQAKGASLLSERGMGKKLKSLAKAVMAVGSTASIAIGLCFGVLVFLIAPLGLFATYVVASLLNGVGYTAEVSEKMAEFLLPTEETTQEPVIEDQEPWSCISCGMENRSRVAYCQNCGTSKQWSQARKEAQASDNQP